MGAALHGAGRPAGPGVGVRVAARLAVAACALAAALPLRAQEAQAQSDVPYVPTPPNVVDTMLKMAGVGPRDFVIDLGSGDGRIVITAAKKFGARGLGVDIDGNLVSAAQREARRQEMAERVEFRAENLFITDLSRATVLTLYLFPRVNLQLRPRLFEELRPGTRVVSHDFDFGSWRPDARVTVPVPDKPYGPPSSEVYLWIVPASAAGDWRWRLEAGGAVVDYELALRQTFQMLAGSALAGGRMARVEGGRMRGEEIGFTLAVDSGAGVERQVFSGRVAGDTIAGRVKPAGGGEREWRARRVKRGSMDIKAGSGGQ